MPSYPKTLIVRHRRENKKKCTLQPIIDRLDCHFVTYPGCTLQNLDNYILLGFEGPELSIEDIGKGIILIDGTWKKASIMQRELFDGRKIEMRSLPKNIFTAYPRRQADCSNPEQGLASIEALYVAYKLMARPSDDLLCDYYWRDAFLEKNETLFSKPLFWS